MVNCACLNRQILFLLIIISLLLSAPALAKKKITMPTDRAAFHNNQGVSYLNKNDLERAEFEFKTAIELSNDYVEAYNNLGIVYKLKSNYPLAAAQFERAIELDKTYAQAYSHLGAVYLAQGKIDDAIKTIKKGLKKDSTIADAHYNLGLAYLEKTRADKNNSYVGMAETEFKKATELDPNLVHVHKKLAEVYLSLGEYDLAIIRYRLSLGNEPDNPDLWNKLGNVYLSKGDQLQAQSCFQKASEINTENSDSGMELGFSYFKEKRYEEAITEFKAVLAKRPLDERAWYRLGSAYLNWADESQAKKDAPQAGRLYAEAAGALKKAKEINPQFSDASYNLGLTLLHQGKTLDAQKEWEYTITIDPKHARAFYNLGLVYRQAGRTSDGLAMLCRFLGAGKDLFPVEEASARQTLDSNHYKCHD